MSDKMDNYLFEDNVKKLCLYDMLRRKKYLQNLTLKELEDLVRSTKRLLSGLQTSFDKGLKMIPVSDEDSWDTSSLFRDCFIHSVLDIQTDPYINDSRSRFKQKLKERWDNADKIRKVTKEV